VQGNEIQASLAVVHAHGLDRLGEASSGENGRCPSAVRPADDSRQQLRETRSDTPNNT
jgi:hypothetical protein